MVDSAIMDGTGPMAVQSWYSSVLSSPYADPQSLAWSTAQSQVCLLDHRHQLVRAHAACATHGYADSFLSCKVSLTGVVLADGAQVVLVAAGGYDGTSSSASGILVVEISIAELTNRLATAEVASVWSALIHSSEV